MSENTNHGLQIVILERGFVCVGETQTNGNWLTISKAKFVRRWGTTKGLGELAAKGPLSSTKLDEGGVINAPLSAVIGLIACEASAWNI